MSRCPELHHNVSPHGRVPKTPANEAHPARPTWSSSARESWVSRPRASCRFATTASGSPCWSARPQIGTHQTGRSSGVIHAGIYYVPGSLKARLCVEGARELYAFCDDRGIPTERGGKLIVATRPEELPRLDELERRGVENEVPGLRRVGARTRSPTSSRMPAASRRFTPPRTGTVDFRVVARAYADDVDGGRRHRHHRLRGARDPRGRRRRGSRARRSASTRAKALVSCAGAWSDRLAVAAGAPAEPRIVPFRGGYLRLRPERASSCARTSTRCPILTCLSWAPTSHAGYDGEVLLGPTALMVGARDAYKVGRIRASDLWQTLVMARNLADGSGATGERA